MKVAVTGASGFVGQHVLSELLRRETDVVAVARDTTRLSNFGNAARLIEMDIGKAGSDIFDRLGRPDILIHLAWDGLPNYRSLHHFEAELPKQYRFLQTLVTEGLASMLVTGTCFEYGMQSGSLSEEILPQPDNPYGYAKNALRQQLQYLKSTQHFNLTWGRLFYMYGEGQASNSLYPKLKDAALRGDKVFNMSGGEQLRDYLPVEEVARAIVRLALAQKDIGVVNICSGEPISVRRLVEQWSRDFNWEIALNFGCYPYPDYEPMAFWGNHRKLKETLDAP